MKSEAGWGWFVLWASVGAAYAMAFLAAFTIGIFFVPLAIGGTVLLACSPGARAAPGLVAGPAGPLFYVAVLNRDGPGNICHSTGLSTSCTQEWSPWPWVGAGAVLVVLACVLFAWIQRRAGVHDEEVKARWAAYLATLAPPPSPPPSGGGQPLG
jgi:hypothetical protein